MAARHTGDIPASETTVRVLQVRRSNLKEERPTTEQKVVGSSAREGDFLAHAESDPTKFIECREIDVQLEGGCSKLDAAEAALHGYSFYYSYNDYAAVDSRALWQSCHGLARVHV